MSYHSSLGYLHSAQIPFTVASKTRAEASPRGSLQEQPSFLLPSVFATVGSFTSIALRLPALSAAPPLIPDRVHYCALTMSLRSLHRKLLALQYPAMDSLFGSTESNAAAGAAAASGSAVCAVSLSSAPLRTLVAWLESSKIRFLPVADRVPLQAITAPDPVWPRAFVSYLTALDCTRPFSESMGAEGLAIVLDWLASQAIAAEYADHAGEFNSLSKMWVVGGASGEAGDDSSSAGALQLDCGSTPSLLLDFESEVQSLAALFQLPYFPDQQAALIRVVRKRVEECMVAEAAAAQTSGSASSKAQPHTAAAVAAQKPTVAAGAGRAASAAASSSSSAASSSAKPPTGGAPKPPRVQRSIRAPEVAPVPTTKEEVFAALDKLETGFPNTGGQTRREMQHQSGGMRRV